MDQNQQNIIKPTNTKKIGAIFGGDFRIWGRNNKIRLENREGGLRNRDKHGSWYQDDVGWNPNRPIFHERSGSREEHEEHEGGKRETQGETQEETLNQHE